MLVYLGSAIIFVSLLWWASWYTGNIELLPEETLKFSSLPSASLVVALRQSASHSLSVNIETVPNNLLMQWWRRRRTLQREASLTVPVSAHGEERLGRKSKDKDGEEGVKESNASQDSGKEDLGPEPEDDENSETVGSPDPDAQPPSMDQLPATHPVHPVLPLHQPVPSPLYATKGLIVAPSISARHPVAIFTSKSQPVVSLAFKSQLAVPMASENHLQVPAVSLSQALMPVASQGQPQNLPRASQTQSPPPGLASQAIKDLEALLQMQQAIPSTSVVQESSLSQSSSVLKVPEMSVAQFPTPKLRLYLFGGRHLPAVEFPSVLMATSRADCWQEKRQALGVFGGIGGGNSRPSLVFEAHIGSPQQYKNAGS
ncbi:uncharacterized protein LOC115895195 [Rhinopithecus roxellana]|uniref:uncharacterized protein LOC115895195 n=1 Tax=Rhinopithecus roxellana TaxID=61622 RepID=UPI0012373C70|nr:uncharacterized protein LOC115895195 [Rhinopithecus roxellana]